jgi:hypothetical protein
VAAVFSVVIVGLVAFGVWAWSGRLHADDLAAWGSLRQTITELDRGIVPLGHSEIPPCRDSADGVITRTYPPSTGPQADEVAGFLVQKGWSESPATAPAIVHLTSTAAGHELTIELVGPARNQLVAELTAHSPASALGCLGRQR